MSRKRAQIAGALTLAALGAGLLWHGDSIRRGAAADLHEASFVAVSRTRALDAMSDGTTADDASTVDRWLSGAREGIERATLEELLGCVTDATSDCSEEVAAAGEHYASSLQAQWSRSDADDEKADWVLLLAGLCFVCGTFWGVYRPAAASESPESSEEPPAEDSSTDAVEALLRQRLEDLYAARLRAWESDRFAAYGELAAGLSHGLKTPLASIRAAAQVAVKKLGADHPAIPQLEDVISEVDALVEQVRRFLQATGTGEPVPARVAPGQLVDAIGAGYAADAKERGVSFETEIASGLGEILVDAALLEMALRNLVENALAVAPKGSTVMVSTKTGEAPSRAGLDSAEPEPGDWIELTVSDEGPGIPDEALAGKVSSTKPNGSGLGLAIARRIVARHGGALVVDTAENAGTSVRMVLPTADAGLAKEAEA